MLKQTMGSVVETFTDAFADDEWRKTLMPLWIGGAIVLSVVSAVTIVSALTRNPHKIVTALREKEPLLTE